MYLSVSVLTAAALYVLSVVCILLVTLYMDHSIIVLFTVHNKVFVCTFYLPSTHSCCENFHIFSTWFLCIFILFYTKICPNFEIA